MEEKITQKLPAIKKFTFEVIDSLLVLLLGVAGFVLIPTIAVLLGFVLGVVWGTYSLVSAVILAFSGAK